MRKVLEIGGILAAVVLIAFGIALLLAGIGFGILAIGGALRNPDSLLKPARKTDAASGTASAT